MNSIARNIAWLHGRANYFEALARGGLFGGSSEGEDGGEENVSEGKEADPAEIERYRKEAERYRQEAQAAEAEKKKREAETRRKKAEADGKLKQELEAETQRREKYEQEIERYRKRDAEAAEKIYKALDPAVRKSADVIKDSLPPDKWLDYLQTLDASTYSDTSGAKRGGRQSDVGKFKINPKAREALAENGYEPKFFDSGKVIATEERGTQIYSMSPKAWREMIKAKNTRNREQEKEMGAMVRGPG